MPAGRKQDAGYGVASGGAVWLIMVALIGLFPAAVSGQHSSGDSAEKVVLRDDGERVEVRLGDDLFTRLEYRAYSKPILFPVRLGEQLSMTRRFPMEDVPGEAHDHPHHMSIWIGHEVNGLDFWAGRSGEIEFERLEDIDSEAGAVTFRNIWKGKEGGQPVVAEETRYQFGGEAATRWIDATITFRAEFGPVTFDDTKEGLFALRTHPQLRLTPDQKNGVDSVSGVAHNAAGGEGKSIWGQASRWVDYSGNIDGTAVGIAFLDHPDNFRHPTRWHARDYGLVAANPFGLHHFAGEELGAGAKRLEKGETLTLRYRLIFYRGTYDRDRTEGWFETFAASER